MNILFVSDYVCPYCIVAKKALLKAINTLGIADSVTIEEQPFELTIPPAPQVDTYHDENRKAHYQVLEAPCKALGIDMKLPPAIVPRPYSQKAFEGFYYALDQGRGSDYSMAVYEAYFIDEQDIGQIAVLRAIAEKLGMDGQAFEEAVESRRYSAKLQAANEKARKEQHIKRVPTLFIDGVQIEEEAYTEEAFMEILKKF